MLLLTTKSALTQHIFGTYPTGGGPISITVTNEDLEVSGLFFDSNKEVTGFGDLLTVPKNDPTPFSSLLSNTSSRVQYWSGGSPVTFKGGTTTELQVGHGGSSWAVSASWGRGPSPIDFPLLALDGPALIGSFSDGEPVSLTALGGDFNLDGIDIQSNGGTLIPFDTGAGPFSNLVVNTPNQITLENQSAVHLAENTTTTLPVRVSADRFASFTASYTDDMNSISPLRIDRLNRSRAPVLDSEDNLLGNGEGMSGGEMQPTPPPDMNVVGGGTQNPAAIPEPSSLLVWVTLVLFAAFQRWKFCIAA